MALDLISYVMGVSNGGKAATGTTSITENGVYDVTTYASAEVNVPNGGKGTIPFSNIFDCIESTTEVTKNA